MSDEAGPRSWSQSLPGILTGLAAVIGAIATLATALHWQSPNEQETSPTSHPERTQLQGDACLPPFVWRQAVPSDHVCVIEDSRKSVELENQRAAERRQPNTGGAYGPDTCLMGYVWREAFKGDTVCVVPARRDEVRQENALAEERIKRPL
jgi:hypothetical protein